MDSRSACIQGVIKVKVKVKGHVIRALSWILGMSYSVIDGLVEKFDVKQSNDLEICPRSLTVVSPESNRVAMYVQESCAIAKMTAQCTLHMGALKIFGTA